MKTSSWLAGSLPRRGNFLPMHPGFGAGARDPQRGDPWMRWLKAVEEEEESAEEEWNIGLKDEDNRRCGGTGPLLFPGIWFLFSFEIF